MSKTDTFAIKDLRTKSLTEITSIIQAKNKV